MDKVTDFLYHATGLCGEHWHPNAINLSLMALAIYAACKVKQRKKAA